MERILRNSHKRCYRGATGRCLVGGERGASAINGGCVGDEAWPTSVLFWSVEQTVITLEGHNRVTTQPNEGSWVTLPVGALRN